MKRYVEDYLDFRTADINMIQESMKDLKNAGWKRLSFNSWHTPEEDGGFIEGMRPYTKRELISIENDKKFELRKELNLLKKLAKKFEYKLVKR